MEQLKPRESSIFKDLPRETLRHEFLTSLGIKADPLTPLPHDASHRRYFRVSQGLLMDAPPPFESTARFEKIAKLLDHIGLSVPQIYAIDHIHGFMLIEDFGELSYRKALQQGADEALLYKEVVQALIFLQQKCPPVQKHLDIPTYTLDSFVKNAALFLDWAPFSISAQAKADFKELWGDAFSIQPPLPHALLLRDVMIDNLLWLPNREGFKRCGFIDFQDASWGPITYDFVSVLEDPRRSEFPASFVNSLIEMYFQHSPHVAQDDFWSSYALWSAQRATRILGGVCFRQAKRNGRLRYLSLIPRLWQILDKNLKHPSLKNLRKWFLEHGPLT